MKKKQENIDERLLLKVIEDRASDSEKELFSEWHDASAKNAELFAGLQQAYALAVFDNYSVQENWQQVVQKVKAGYTVPDYIELPEPKQKAKVVNLSILLRVAAVIVLAIGITFLFKNIVFNPEQLIVSGSDLKNNEAYQLADGSLVYLHGESTISFAEDFGSKNRNLTLKGEAFFEVSKNENLHFVITTNKIKTRVVGTSFNVFSNSVGEVKVSVVSGVVNFYANKNNFIELRAGEQGAYNPVKNGIKKTINDENFQAWRTGVLIFKDTPLSEAFELLSRHYSQVFLFQESGDEMPILTTTFDNQPLQAVQEELNLLLNTKNVFRNDTIIFKTN